MSEVGIWPVNDAKASATLGNGQPNHIIGQGSALGLTLLTTMTRVVFRHNCIL